jgi:hypothetical protein
MFDVTPLLSPMKKCSHIPLKSGYVLIVAAGFEDRTLTAVQMVKRTPYSNVLVLTYKPDDKRNKIDEVKSGLHKKGFRMGRSNMIEYDRYDPEEFPHCLAKALERLGARAVVIDVSAMSKLAIILALDVCREMNLDVNVFYAEAKTYGPAQQDYERAKTEKDLHRPSIQVYSGVHKVIRVTRLSSVAMQGQPTAAIAFMSFNEVLTQALLNTVYPSRLFLINGRPPMLSWREEATAWIHEQLRQEWLESDNPLERQTAGGKLLPKRVTSTLNYRETVQTLLNLYWALAIDHRIILAPTGSKMQAMGGFFAKVLHPDIHIEYPTPSGFLDLYSKGIGRKWLVQFGPLGERMEALRRLERKRCIEVGVVPRKGLAAPPAAFG